MPDEILIDAPDGSVVGWLTRTYDIYQDWLKKAREIYFHSNGDSELARQLAAILVRSYFLEEKLTVEVVKTWSGQEQVDRKVAPPKVTASNASYFDWLRAADYLLLPCASVTDELQEENQRRENAYQVLFGSFTLRTQVNTARAIIRENSDLDDAAILDLVQQKYPAASLANVKDAKRLEAKREPMQVPVEPKRLPEMPIYKSLS